MPCIRSPPNPDLSRSEFVLMIGAPIFKGTLIGTEGFVGMVTGICVVTGVGMAWFICIPGPENVRTLSCCGCVWSGAELFGSFSLPVLLSLIECQ